ncbi:MAG: signal peptidase I [Planctomycetota bacterium]|jgi:signal peptidase I
MEAQKQDNMRETDYPNRRRPWIAVFLSLLMPGMGQIYCGSIVEGLVLMLTVIMFSTFWMFIMIVDRVRENTPIAVPFVALGFVLAATVVAVVDAYRRARRTRYDYILKDYNKLGVYMALLWICGAGTFGFTAIVKMNLFEAFYVSANSMAPSIMLEDRVFASKLSYKNNNPAYGDVVLFKDPANRKDNNIKRVVGLGGDIVEIKEGRLLINGNLLEREQIETKTIRMGENEIAGDMFWERNGNARYKIFVSEQEIENQTQVKDFGPVTVPKFHCFVMGDNRNHSEDSRNYGSLSYGALKGRLTQIYWPLSRSASLNAQQ